MVSDNEPAEISEPVEMDWNFSLYAKEHRLLIVNKCVKCTPDLHSFMVPLRLALASVLPSKRGYKLQNQDTQFSNELESRRINSGFVKDV